MKTMLRQRILAAASAAFLALGLAFNLADPVHAQNWRGANVSTLTVTGQGLFADGTAGAPGISFSADADTGLYRHTSNLIGVSSGGTARLGFTTAGIKLAAASNLEWSSTSSVAATSDVILTRAAANTLSLRNSTNAQTFLVSGTFTDTSNYERLSLSTTTGTGATIATDTAGTGADNLSLSLAASGTGLVQVARSGTMQLGVTSGATSTGLQVRTAQQTAPTCSSNCGTSPSITGSDTAMTVTMGSSGSPASGFVVTFNGTWASAPACVGAMGKTGMVVGKLPLTIVTTTTTITVVTNGTAPATTDVYHFHCLGVS